METPEKKPLFKLSKAAIIFIDIFYLAVTVYIGYYISAGFTVNPFNADNMPVFAAFSGFTCFISILNMHYYKHKVIITEI